MNEWIKNTTNYYDMGIVGSAGYEITDIKIADIFGKEIKTGAEGGFIEVYFLKGEHAFEIRTIGQLWDETAEPTFREILSTFKFINSDIITIMNTDRDFWATNYGVDGIAFNFADVPVGTSRLQIVRSVTQNKPINEIVIDVPYPNDLPTPLIDNIDGTKSSYLYALLALSKDGQVLKKYGAISVPKSN